MHDIIPDDGEAAEVARLRDLVLDLGQAVTDLTARQAAQETWRHKANRILAKAYELDGRPVPAEFREDGEAPGDRPQLAGFPGPEPVTQRELDDAVASLIRDARREFGQGGAR